QVQEQVERPLEDLGADFVRHGPDNTGGVPPPGAYHRWPKEEGPMEVRMARVLSEIKPTGHVHLGNYLGALQHWVAEQHDADAFHAVVDLHALTIEHDPAELRERTLELARMLVAIGLDPDVTTLFVQSHVPEHAQLNW